MTVWALNYATKSGLVIKAREEEVEGIERKKGRKREKKIVIKSIPLGKMYAPDPDDFVKSFLDQLKEGDIVLSGSGPNNSYIVGAASKCEVCWMHSGKLAKELNGSGASVADALLHLYEVKPQDFYVYQPTDGGIAHLRFLVQEWLGLERRAVADINAHSQALRREAEYFKYIQPKQESWIVRFAEFLRGKLATQLRSFGVRLEPSQQETFEKKAQDLAARLYEDYFSREASKASKEREKLALERMDWFGVSKYLEYHEKEVSKWLVGLPENQLFDGLISEGTHRVRAQILAYIKNPLMFENVRALLAYAGVSIIEDGQVVQRRHGQSSRGNPAFKKALVYDFAEKYWQNDTIGIFERLYYAYKRSQYYTYWDLIVLTQEVFMAFGRRGGEEEEEVNESTQNEEFESGMPAAEKVRVFATRLEAMSHLPLIRQNRRIKEEIKLLKTDPNPKRLWNIFIRGRSTFRPGESGFNLQLPRKRVERQVKRMLGTVLVKAVYYRWLKMLDMPVPLEKDEIYLNQWKAVRRNSELPEFYDPEVVIEFYKQRADQLKKELAVPLPPEVEFRLLMVHERIDFLQSLSDSQKFRVIKALTPKEQDKYGLLLPAEMREQLKKGRKKDEETEEDGEE